MRFRKLRFVWSVGCFIAVVLLCVLWVRSYARVDVIAVPMIASKQVGIWSGGGRIEMYLGYVDLTQQRWQFTTSRRDEMLAQVKASGKKVDRSYFGITNAGVRFPTYLFVLMAALFAGFPWLRWRFTLRTLLIAITAVAMVLGLIVWLTN